MNNKNKSITELFGYFQWNCRRFATVGNREQTVSENCRQFHFFLQFNELQPWRVAIFGVALKRGIVCNCLRLSAPFFQRLQSVCNSITRFQILIYYSIIDLFLIFIDLFQLATYWQAFARICYSLQLSTILCKIEKLQTARFPSVTVASNTQKC